MKLMFAESCVNREFTNKYEVRGDLTRYYFDYYISVDGTSDRNTKTLLTTVFCYRMEFNTMFELIQQNK